MSHRSVRRGTAVLTFVLALTLAGPAHAAPRAFTLDSAWGWWTNLTSLWQAVTGEPGTPPAPDRGAGLDPDGGNRAQDTGDRGAGLDPDGRH